MKDNTGYGRIYRISPKNKTLKTPLIDLATTEGQVARAWDLWRGRIGPLA